MVYHPLAVLSLTFCVCCYTPACVLPAVHCSSGYTCWMFVYYRIRRYVCLPFATLLYVTLFYRTTCMLPRWFAVTCVTHPFDYGYSLPGLFPFAVYAAPAVAFCYLDHLLTGCSFTFLLTFRYRCRYHVRSVPRTILFWIPLQHWFLYWLHVACSVLLRSAV